MAVILNGTVITSPSLTSAIREGGSIEGSFTQREVSQLEADLKAGSLSFTPRILSEKNVSAELGTLPSRHDVAEWPRLQGDATLQASWAQLVEGRLMPVVPEMRVLWDVMRPGLQQVVSGRFTPEEASAQMQQDAVRKIAELKL